MLFQIGSTIFGFTWKVYNLQKQKENGELKSWKKTLTSRLFIQAKIKLWKSPNIRTQRTGNCRPCERYVRSFLLCSDGLKFLETFVWYFPLPILLCLLVNRISMVFSTCERKIKKKETSTTVVLAMDTVGAKWKNNYTTKKKNTKRSIE